MDLKFEVEVESLENTSGKGNRRRRNKVASSEDSIANAPTPLKLPPLALWLLVHQSFGEPERTSLIWLDSVLYLGWPLPPVYPGLKYANSYNPASAFFRFPSTNFLLFKISRVAYKALIFSPNRLFTY